MLSSKKKKGQMIAIHIILQTLDGKALFVTKW